MKKLLLSLLLIPLAVLASSKLDLPKSEDFNSMISMELLNSEKVTYVTEDEKDSEEVLGCLTISCNGCVFTVYYGGKVYHNISYVRVCN